LPAHFHYDPYYKRYEEYLKRLVSEGNPIVVRLHPGVYYPMKEETLRYRVDREGHVVAVIGYDNETQEVILADPWNNEHSDGERSGIFRMPFDMFRMQFVDATLSAMTMTVPWDLKLILPDEIVDTFKSRASIKYSCPTPLPKSYNRLHDVQVNDVRRLRLATRRDGVA
jgi:hypothetical protein